MKKLFVALAVVASIGVTLSENNVVSNKAQYSYYIGQGYTESYAWRDAYRAYTQYSWMTWAECYGVPQKLDIIVTNLV
jgi:ribulose bisphosphate carboxylase small subunit